MRTLRNLGGTFAIVAVFALSACGNSDSSSDITSTRTKNAVLAQSDPEKVVDDVDAIATKQIVTTTAAPTTTVAEAVVAASAATTTAAPAESSEAVSSATTITPAADEVESSSDGQSVSTEKTLSITDDSIASDVLTNKSAEMSADNDADDSSNTVVYIVLLALILGAGGYAYSRKKK
jgi:hypothetical protein